jgi:hypothetical protein
MNALRFIFSLLLTRLLAHVQIECKRQHFELKIHVTSRFVDMSRNQNWSFTRGLTPLFPQPICHIIYLFLWAMKMCWITTISTLNPGSQYIPSVIFWHKVHAKQMADLEERQMRDEIAKLQDDLQSQEAHKRIDVEKSINALERERMALEQEPRGSPV